MSSHKKKLPVSGIADLHCHPLANIALGGQFLWGTPDGPIEHALSTCAPIHSVTNGLAGFLHINPNLPLVQATKNLLDSVINSFLEPADTHFGFEKFDGWPKYTTITHQQMYLDWIKRAHDLGNLNLIVATVVNDELISTATGDSSKVPLDDKDSLDFQVEKIKEFVSKSGFMEIALTPEGARNIIRLGKLAVVLGIEVGTINNFWHDPTNDEITTFLDHLKSLGVFHVITIHLIDNVFGGTATYDDRFNVENRILRGHYYELEQDMSKKPVQIKLQNFGAIPGGETVVSALTDVLNITKGHLKYSQDTNTIKMEKMYNAPIRAGAGWCVTEMVSE